MRRHIKTLAMDPDLEKAEEFSDTEDPLSQLSVDDEEEEREGEEEKEEEDEEEDAKIFNAWMLKYKGGEHHEKPEKEEAKEEDPGTGQLESGSTTESPVRMRADRRASLPCPVREHTSIPCIRLNMEKTKLRSHLVLICLKKFRILTSTEIECKSMHQHKITLNLCV